MEDLRLSIEKAKRELKKKIKIPGEMKNEFIIETTELKELEKLLKLYIKQSEKILKQNNIN